MVRKTLGDGAEAENLHFRGGNATQRTGKAAGLVDGEGLWLDGESPVRLPEFFESASELTGVHLSPTVGPRLAESRQLLERLVAENRLIYGITTGYGALATEHVSASRAVEMQRYLIYHLTSGVGPALCQTHTRAVMLARIISLARGFSAIREESLRIMITCLNHNLLPVVPAMGTVGASGDLNPLAHVALGLMGEGYVRYRNEEVPAAQALKACGLAPLRLEAKEGLSLVNGTSAMTGIACVNGIYARRAAILSVGLSLLYAEVYRGKREAFHPAFSSVRAHPGQTEAASLLHRLSAGSGRMVQKPAVLPVAPDPDSADGEIHHARPLPQDAYSIRCTPQLLGAVIDMIAFHNHVAETELNSVTDNPLVFPEDETVYQGGNFFGQHVSFVSDLLTNALIKIGIHSERKVARITDVKLSDGLPPFLQGRQTGLHCGFMGAQLTSTALVAEMRSKAMPASIQSISTNANNQDVVTMGTIAARRAAEMVEHLYNILSIEALALVQAFELQGGFHADSGFSPCSRMLAERVRLHAAFLDEDRPLYQDIAGVADMLRRCPWESMIPAMAA